jgi:hypothetical protein
MEGKNNSDQDDSGDDENESNHTDQELIIIIKDSIEDIYPENERPEVNNENRSDGGQVGKPVIRKI